LLRPHEGVASTQVGEHQTDSLLHPMLSTPMEGERMITYQELMKYMSKAKDTTKGRPVGKATRMKMKVIDNTPVVDVVYHETVVVRTTPTRIELNNGGYYTPTTAKRINQYLPEGCSVWRRNGSWYYVNRAGYVASWDMKISITHEGWITSY
jgi:hypothetical protein